MTPQWLERGFRKHRQDGSHLHLKFKEISELNLFYLANNSKLELEETQKVITKINTTG
jgi:hypothetical protein